MSLVFRGAVPAIKLEYVRPAMIMAAVDIVLSTSFWAVPFFILVEPATTSGPTSGAITRSASLATVPAASPTIATVLALSLRASARAPATKGVRPEEVIPTTMSRGPALLAAIWLAPSSQLSSAPSDALDMAFSPPDMMAITFSPMDPYVGSNSDASSTPILPLVPAPT